MDPFRLSPLARRDLLEIVDYVAANSNRARAEAVKRDILCALTRLAMLPGMGHRREDLAPELRFWAVYSYLIVYRPDPKPIEIVRVLSGWRDVAALLEEGGGE